jgi:hypothetical protein
MTEQIVSSSQGICPHCGGLDSEFMGSDQYDDIVSEDYTCIDCDKDFVENYEIVYYETVYDDENEDTPVVNKKTNVRW